jgi:1-deoxy-D-xylulose-5-phosphate synthase
VTVEEHAVMAGAGSAVNEFLAQAKIVKPILNLGLPDAFLHQATHQQMLRLWFRCKGFLLQLNKLGFANAL